jgi:hypothetical protein
VYCYHRAFAVDIVAIRDGEEVKIGGEGNGRVNNLLKE